MIWRTLLALTNSGHGIKLLACVLLIASALLQFGCSCSDDSNLTPAELAAKQEEEEAKKSEEEKKKAAEKKPKILPFDVPELSVLPQFTPEAPKQPPPSKNKVPLTEEEVAAQAIGRWDFVKPFHWHTVTERRQSNEQDLPGAMIHAELLSGGSAPVGLEDSAYSYSVERDLGLSKGQPKYPKYRLYAAPGRNLFWNSSLRDRRGGGDFQSWGYPLTRLDPQSYLFVVLTKDKSRVEKWRDLDTLRSPGRQGLEYDYRLIVPLQANNAVSLPDNLIDWSAISVLVWDNTDPSLLTAEQQKALIDWLYFGGQLVINGPTSLDQLKGSFLDESPKTSLLPGTNWQAQPIDQEQIDEINNYWSSRPGSPARDQAIQQLKMLKPWDGLKLQPGNLVQTVSNTGNLILTRSVGRGRVVTSLFNLKQKEFNDWPGMDSFLNSAILGRAARTFLAGNSNEFNSPYVVRYAQTPQSTDHIGLGIYHNTKYRLLTRDWHPTGLPDGKLDPLLAASAPPPNSVPRFQPNYNEFPDGTETLDTESQYRNAGGWNDQHELAAAVRTSLGEASGIKIPNVQFVGMMLAVYLAVLVVLNYGVFRVLGRVEYAWFAAPIIAIAGSLAVIKLAQLDIGFARSQTEIAVLECYNGHPRAHLTRYTGLYSSLSTTYELKFDSGSAVALPFTNNPGQSIKKSSLSPLVLKQDDNELTLQGFQVISNSSSMVHSEQLQELGGALEYTTTGGNGIRLQNQTKYDLEEVVLVRKKENDLFQYVYLGKVPQGRTVAQAWSATEGKLDDLLNKEWQQLAGNQSDDEQLGRPTSIPLRPVLSTLCASKSLQPGEIRAIAIIPRQLPGLTISPAAAQSERSLTIVVCHLQTVTTWLTERDQGWRPAVSKLQD